MKFLESLFNLFKGLAIMYMAIIFLAWYIKGHFGKYFLFFWISSFICVYQSLEHDRKMKERDIYKNMTGAEVWEANQRNDY